MKRMISVLAALLALCQCGCTSDNEAVTADTSAAASTAVSVIASQDETTEEAKKAEPYIPSMDYASEMLPEEKKSIETGKLSENHPFYNEVMLKDKGCRDYITEISLYDTEIGDTFVVHVQTPVGYDETESYPMVLMTDGAWRLSDHVELRGMMNSGSIEKVILVSVGYPDDYDYEAIRERDLVTDAESFMHFITENLVPYLSSKYSIDIERSTLTGHSYGGFWTLYALFNHDLIGNCPFGNYYIGSPSLQANTKTRNITWFEEQYELRNDSLPCKIYMCAGSKEMTTFTNPIQYLSVNMKNSTYDGLELTYELIEGESHSTVFKPSIRKALELFYGK